MSDEKWAKFFELMEKIVSEQGFCVGSITGMARMYDSEPALDKFVEEFGGELPEELEDDDMEDNSTRE